MTVRRPNDTVNRNYWGTQFVLRRSWREVSDELTWSGGDHRHCELPTQRTNPGRSALGLMGDVARMAVHDAHLRKEDIDGLVTEGGTMYPGMVSEYLGIRPRFASGASMMGASGATATTLAAMAVQNGMANNVLVVIGFSRNPRHPGARRRSSRHRNRVGRHRRNGAGAGTGYAMMYKKHHGALRDYPRPASPRRREPTLQHPREPQLGLQRPTHHGRRRPRLAVRELPAPPVGVCDASCGGAAALVITSADRAKSSHHPPVYILGSGVGTTLRPHGSGRDNRDSRSPLGADCLRDIRVHAAGHPVRGVLRLLHNPHLDVPRGRGLVPKGEIGPFFASTDTTYKGSFPINTDGGQLSSGQPNLAGGFRHVIEGARQIMGRAETGKSLGTDFAWSMVEAVSQHDVHAGSRVENTL